MTDNSAGNQNVVFADRESHGRLTDGPHVKSRRKSFGKQENFFGLSSLPSQPLTLNCRSFPLASSKIRRVLIFPRVENIFLQKKKKREKARLTKQDGVRGRFVWVVGTQIMPAVFFYLRYLKHESDFFHSFLTRLFFIYFFSLDVFSFEITSHNAFPNKMCACTSLTS